MTEYLPEQKSESRRLRANIDKKLSIDCFKQQRQANETTNAFLRESIGIVCQYQFPV